MRIGRAILIVLFALAAHAYAGESTESVIRGAENMAEDLGQLSIALGVADVAKSVDFYERLGFEPIEKETWNDDYAVFRYKDFTLQLMNFIPQKVLVNLMVEDQSTVDATWARLAERGIPVGPAGAPESGNKGAFWQDPDGNSFFLFAEHKRE
jgi:catechol 2,3-dioxygenase-like lactoylglutathione lyase family enzyme